MSAGQTNRQVLVAGLDVEAEQGIRDAAAAQGCMCGADLVVVPRQLTREERALVPESAAKSSAFEVRHHQSCPLLRRLEGVN